MQAKQCYFMTSKSPRPKSSWVEKQPIKEQCEDNCVNLHNIQVYGLWFHHSESELGNLCICNLVC